MHWIASLMKYCRPFVTGVLKWGRDDALAALTEQEREAHERMLAERNGYIAHSVGDMEVYVPVVRLHRLADGSAEIEKVLCNHSRIAGPSSTHVEWLVRLREKMANFVRVEIAAEGERLLLLAREIGAEALAVEPEYAPTYMRAPTSPKQPRPKFPPRK
jgi:hypothetical protein